MCARTWRLSAVVVAGLGACHSDELTPDQKLEQAQQGSVLPGKDWHYVGFVPWEAGGVGIDGRVYVTPMHVSVYGGVVQTAVRFGTESQQGRFEQYFVGRFTNGFVRSDQEYSFYLNNPSALIYDLGVNFGFYNGQPWGNAWWILQNGDIALTNAPGAIGTDYAPDGDPDTLVENFYRPTYDETGTYVHAFAMTQAFRIGIRRGGQSTYVNLVGKRQGIGIAFDGPVAWIAAEQQLDDGTWTVGLWKQVTATAPLEQVGEIGTSPNFVLYEVYAANGHVAVFGQDASGFQVAYWDGTTLAQAPVPAVQQDLLSEMSSLTVNLTSDGSILYGYIDAGHGTIAELVDGAIVPLGKPFTKDAVVPVPFNDGNGNVYALFENTGPEGAAIACHGPSCVPYVPPVHVPTSTTPDAATPLPTILSCTNTTTCKEVTGFVSADYPAMYESYCTNTLKGMYATTGCSLTNVNGGCRLTDSTGLVTTSWFPNDTVQQVMSICNATGQMFVTPGQ